MTTIGGRPGIDATKKIPGKDFKRVWPPLTFYLRFCKASRNFVQA
jgi:hypothetical protein